jgi:hypothetical protein
MNSMPIDLATVDWLYVVVLALIVFLATLVASVLSFGRRFLGAMLSAVLFAAAFVFWTYYPHHLPLPTALAPQKAAVTTAPGPAAPAAPTRPRNPVTDITPPAAPASPPPAAAPTSPPPAR